LRGAAPASQELSPPSPVFSATAPPSRERKEVRMHGLIYLIGLIVVIMAILSFFGLR
jgi:hypothetical protein